MQLEIRTTFFEDDTERTGDWESRKLFIDGVEVMTGDEYHDDITARIDGFLVALNFLKIPYEVNHTELNEPPFIWIDPLNVERNER